ncbi:MAG TPA: hypothetical protein DCL61_21165 [Cyanobacteria bacterium UBA12227]|nr:hypothetical protein [Cyanobacteria bacterium UBA12227]
MLVVGCWLLVFGCWLLFVGCWLLVVVCWLLFVVCCLFSLRPRVLRLEFSFGENKEAKNHLH